MNNTDKKQVLLLGEHLLSERTKEEFYGFRYSNSKDPTNLTWREVELNFVPDQSKRYDAVLVINSSPVTVDVVYKEDQLYALMQEPGEPFEHGFMLQKKNQFNKFFSHLFYAKNTVISSPHIGWYFSLSYHYLKNMDQPQKDKPISCVASNARRLYGHRQRFRFVKRLKASGLPIDFFGKGSQPIEKKEEALLPYRYSVAIENSSRNGYFTEKIQDCFLTYTVPLYYGCQNIGKYFPEKSFIAIDIRDYRSAEKKIRDVIEFNDWEARMSAVREARELVLEKYHPFAFAADQIIPLTQLVKQYKLQKIKAYGEEPLRWKLFNLIHIGYFVATEYRYYKIHLTSIWNLPLFIMKRIIKKYIGDTKYEHYKTHHTSMWNLSLYIMKKIIKK